VRTCARLVPNLVHGEKGGRQFPQPVGGGGKGKLFGVGMAVILDKENKGKKESS